MTTANRIKFRSVLALVAAAFGLALLLAAALTSNVDIEGVLSGDHNRDLAWGPSLFRILLAIHGLAVTISAIWLWRKRGTAGDSQTAQARYGPSKSVYILVAGLCVVALVLRLWRLNSGLWFDEVLTLLDFVRPPLTEIISSFPSKNQHLLFSILAHSSVRLFGESAWALRLPSAVLGAASIWALFLLARKTIDTTTALLAPALLTVSYHHIWFSQNARGYMGLMFFATLATWLWLEAWDRGGTWWLSYAVISVLGAWMHMTMVFVVASHVMLYLIWLARPSLLSQSASHPTLTTKRLWQPLLAWALCGTLTLQVYALALPEFLRIGIHEVSAPSEWISLWWVLTESVRSLKIGFAGVIVLLAGASMFGVGIASLLRQRRLAVLSMVLPLVLTGVTTLIWSHNFWPRLFFFGIGFGLLFAIRGALMLPLLLRITNIRLFSEPRLQVAGIALACLMIVASTLTVSRCYALPKQDFGGARDFVEHNRNSEDAVVAVGLAGIAYSRYFAPQWASAQTQVELDAATQGHSQVWLIYTIPIEVKAYRPEIWQAIEKDFSVLKIFPGTLGGGEVFVCREREGLRTANLQKLQGARAALASY